MTRNNDHLRKARRVYTKYSLNERILRTLYTEAYAGDIKDEICLYIFCIINTDIKNSSENKMAKSPFNAPVLVCITYYVC